MVHVSCLITCHGEGALAHRTLLTLANAREFARARGVLVEIVAVLDRATAATQQYFSLPSGLWDRKIETDCGDAGLARNAGVKNCQGEYIAIWDGDDLMPEDWFEVCYRTNEKAGHQVILHAEWVMTFGRAVHVLQQIDQDSPQCFVSNHLVHNYWSALCFAHRSVFEKTPYEYADHAKGFGFEDMHWNCQTIARGFVHRVLPGSVHLVRLKESGSRNLVHLQNRTVVPPSELFSVETLSRFCPQFSPSSTVRRRGALHLSATREVGRAFAIDVLHLLPIAKQNGVPQSFPTRAKRVLLSFLRLNHYVFVKPVLMILPRSLGRAFWGVLSPFTSSAWVNGGKSRLPLPILEQLSKQSAIEPQLVFSQNQAMQIAVVRPHPFEAEVARLYLGLAGLAAKFQPKVFILLPENLSELSAAYYADFIKSRWSEQPLLVIGFQESVRSHFEDLNSRHGYFVFSYGVDEAPKFAEILCRLALQYPPQEFLIFSGEIASHLVKNHSLQMGQFTSVHLLLGEHETALDQRKTISVAFGQLTQLTSIRFLDTATRSAIEKFFGPLEGRIS